MELAGTYSRGYMSNIGTALTGKILCANGVGNSPSYRATPLISTAGIMTNSSQPAFSLKLSGNVGAVTGDGTQYQILYDTVTFDQGSAYNSSTHNYVFPVAGIYQINILYFVYTSSGSATSTSVLGYAYINGTTNLRLIDANPLSLGLTVNSEFMASASFMYKAAVNDTMGVFIQLSAGTKNIGVAGGAESCIFSGFLVA